MTAAADWLAQYPASTAETYGRSLDEFAATCGNIPDRATQTDVLAYQARISEQAPATVARKLASLGSWFKYLQRRGIRTDNPMLAVRLGRYRADPMRTVRYLTVDEVGALLAATDDDRERAVIVVLLHGLRLGELVSLNVNQYREQALMSVEGKGGRVRNVPLTSAALPVLDRYLGRRRSGALFLSRTRRRIQRRAVQDIIYRVSARAGKRISPHQLRHTAGTTLLRAGVDLAAVQDLLGHASPATTRLYARLTLTDLRRSVEAAALLGSEPLHIVNEKTGDLFLPRKEIVVPGSSESTPPKASQDAMSR